MLAPVLALAVLTAQPTHPLRFSWKLDGAITGVGAATWFVSEFALKKDLAPLQCRWCDENALDAALRGLRWAPGQLGTADTVSGVIAFGALPVGMIGLDALLARDSLRSTFPEDVVIIAESAVLAVLVDQSVKFIAGRERPFVHALSPAQKLGTADRYDNNLSFFSGHTAFSFAIAVAAGEVAELRGYPSAWVAWAVGLPLAAGVGYLRIAADKHYLTDVLTGGAVGAAFGWGVPYLLHGRLDAQVSPGPGGIAISGRF